MGRKLCPRCPSYDCVVFGDGPGCRTSRKGEVPSNCLCRGTVTGSWFELLFDCEFHDLNLLHSTVRSFTTFQGFATSNESGQLRSRRRKCVRRGIPRMVLTWPLPPQASLNSVINLINLHKLVRASFNVDSDNRSGCVVNVRTHMNLRFRSRRGLFASGSWAGLGIADDADAQIDIMTGRCYGIEANFNQILTMIYVDMVCDLGIQWTFRFV